ncbi:MAG: ketopantoate reductase family protein [Bacillota bacterium]|nr:ketopantoate reductase family protein [Bacillota bacterium]
MRKLEKVSIIGLGAVGCTYGSKLQDLMKNSFKVIASKERALKYRNNGFIINGNRYDFTYADPNEKCEPDDLIIVSVKSTQLKQAIEDIKNHVGQNTIILSLLNGITSEEMIGNTYGMEKLLYSICIGDYIHKNNVINFSDICHIKFGEKTNFSYSEKVQSVKDLFDRAKISYEIPEDMMHILWWKFMMNVGINQSSAVLKGTYGTFQSNKYAIELMDSAMKEVVELSKKTGVNLNQKDLDNWYKLLSTVNPNSRTSMCQDVLSGKKTEVDIFAGTVCDLGKKYGIETPVNKTLLNIIKSME